MSEDVLQAFLLTFGGQLVIQCPVVLALIAGAAVGLVALVRNNRLAGALAFGGFAALALLLFLQLLSGVLPTVLYKPGMSSQEVQNMGLLLVALNCTFSALKTVGLLAVIGSLAAYVFRKTSNVTPDA